MESWIDLLGRLHPLVLHLPIGILVLLVLLEIGNLIAQGAGSNRLPDITDGTRAFILFCLGATTILSAAFGLMLANGGGYDDKLIFDHRLYGLISVALALVLFLVHRRAFLYSVTLIATVLVMVLAGHNGGSLTHGKGYLAGFLRQGASDREDADTTVSVNSLDEVEVFAHLVQPIFENRCVTCHGDSKQKGELRLDSWEFVEQGGESGAVIVAGDADESLLIKRISLPEDHDDHMPPDGKPQPSIEEIELLEWWVESGGSSPEFIVNLDAPKGIRAFIASELGLEVVEEEPLPDRAWVMAEARRLETELGIFTQPLHPTEPWLEVNARLQFDAFNDESLAALESLAPVIQRLDLGETAVTDAGLAFLAPMENLRILKLDRTQITDAGLSALKSLETLSSLVLFSTGITDRGAEILSKLPNLKSVFLWDTMESREAAAKLEESLSNVRLTERLKDQIETLESEIRQTEAEVNLGESAAVIDNGPDEVESSR